LNRRQAERAAGWLLAFACACGDGGAAPGASASAASPGGPASAPVSSADEDYDRETSTRPIEVLKFKLTSGIKSRDPVDEIDHASAGERVYAHLTLRNRTGRARKIHLTFTVNGEVRTELDLDVEESWSWRTWGYNTMLPKDKQGRLELSVTDEEGHPLVESSLPIR